ncbi:DUF2388 domain-containing protein [Pseudomonas fluorescens]|uniref:DUF2388 domain-containing protein n=1 Tax=Pseudomonas fluorescens TaxID=294 RepID=UPI001CD6710C|nr:DUF2388 domain-containing protein [Pseudomonas fluorescens]
MLCNTTDLRDKKNILIGHGGFFEVSAVSRWRLTKKYLKWMQVCMYFYTAIPVPAAANIFDKESYVPTIITFITPITLMMSSEWTKDSNNNARARSQNYDYAKDDAAAFIASNGEIRGAQFERALMAFREYDASHENTLPYYSDLGVAYFILSGE